MKRGILLHGRERTPEEMLRLAAKLDLPDIRWAAPAAENGRWYPNRFMEPIASNEPFLSRSVELVDEAADDVVLIGFSQGACLAVEYALRHPGRCRTVVVFTGGLIGPEGTRWPTPNLAGMRVLITGTEGYIGYLLAPTDDGTRLTNVVELESASGALRLAAPLAASRVKRAVAANLDTLKKLLERESRCDKP